MREYFSFYKDNYKHPTRNIKDHTDEKDADKMIIFRLIRQQLKHSFNVMNISMLPIHFERVFFPFLLILLLLLLFFGHMSLKTS